MAIALSSSPATKADRNDLIGEGPIGQQKGSKRGINKRDQKEGSIRGVNKRGQYEGSIRGVNKRDQ